MENVVTLSMLLIALDVANLLNVIGGRSMDGMLDDLFHELKGILFKQHLGFLFKDSFSVIVKAVIEGNHHLLVLLILRLHSGYLAMSTPKIRCLHFNLNFIIATPLINLLQLITII